MNKDIIFIILDFVADDIDDIYIKYKEVCGKDEICYLIEDYKKTDAYWLYTNKIFDGINDIQTSNFSRDRLSFYTSKMYSILEIATLKCSTEVAFKYFVRYTKCLLRLCERINFKQNKMLIARNIMKLVYKNRELLVRKKNIYRFMETVRYKCDEFLDETDSTHHPDFITLMKIYKRSVSEQKMFCLQ